MDNKHCGALPDFDGGILTQEMMLIVFLKSSCRSLARFKSVSKTWDAFLSHANFAQLYTKRVLQKHTNYLVLGAFVKKSRKLMMISKPPGQDLDFFMVKFPESATKMVMVGSCNGLICLVNVRKQNGMIWNPITKEKKLIQVPPSPHSSSQVGYGIGHDFRYDYKIVRLVYLSTFPYESLVQVFSVNSNSWNDCGIVPFYPDAPNSCFNIKGVPYWVGLCEGGLKRIICSFDLNSERYVQYDFPSGTGTSLVNIVNIKDNLSAVVHAYGFVEIYTFDTLTSTWVKGIKTGPLDIWFEVRRLNIFKDSNATMALGWKGTEMIFYNNSDNSTLPHRGIGKGSFNPDSIGPFPHTIALARIQPKPENEKVEAQPLLHPKLVCGTIRNCCLEAENELENSLPTLLFPVAGKKFDLVMASTESASKDPLKEFYIPDYILFPSSKADQQSGVPTCPVLVFINSKSGGQLGGDLLVTYRSLLNKNQVFDLGEETPDKVLRRLFFNLEKFKLSGDELALKIQERLRLIVAGGDGTAGWLLSVVCDLKLSHPPPIATVPLGTGNNLPFAFGWGKKNPGTDRRSVISFLNQVKKANEMKIDSWHIILRMKAPKEGACDPIAPLELPHSLHAFHRVASSDELNKEGCHTFRGGFWNYFSMGMDAQVSYAFHSERKLHPEKFENQLVNQKTYAKLGCTQGWFSASLVHPSSRNIAQLAKVKVMKSTGEWQDLNIPSYIRSIVCLNLPSFSGGFNPWGTPNRKKIRDRDLTPPYVDDGLLEIVGFRDAWHGLVLLAPNGHGTRLAQARRIKFEFRRGAARETFMRIDGEPWKQPLPVDDDTVVVEISALGQVKMLAVENCKSKSVYDPSTPVLHEVEEGDSSDEEEGRKFSVADTFRMPDKVDVSHLG